MQEKQEGWGGEQLRARRSSLCLVIQPAVKYLSHKRRDALLRADEGQISKTPSKDNVCSASFDCTLPLRL